jgi:hypothetical protein
MGAWGGNGLSVTICRRASIDWFLSTLYHDLEGFYWVCRFFHRNDGSIGMAFDFGCGFDDDLEPVLESRALGLSSLQQLLLNISFLSFGYQPLHSTGVGNIHETML